MLASPRAYQSASGRWAMAGAEKASAATSHATSHANGRANGMPGVGVAGFRRMGIGQNVMPAGGGRAIVAPP